MYCRSWRKKSCFWMPHGPTNEQMWCQSGQCRVTIAQFPQRPTIWPCSRSLTRSNSFTGPLLTSSVSSTSNAYTTIAVSSSHTVYGDPSGYFAPFVRSLERSELDRSRLEEVADLLLAVGLEHEVGEMTFLRGAQSELVHIPLDEPDPAPLDRKST